MADHDPQDIRAQERADADRKSRSKTALLLEEADLVWLMDGKKGRRICWRILDQSGVRVRSFHQNALQMAFNEGTRAFGQELLDKVLTLAPDNYVLMLKEHDDDNRNSAEASDDDQN